MTVSRASDRGGIQYHPGPTGWWGRQCSGIMWSDWTGRTCRTVYVAATYVRRDVIHPFLMLLRSPEIFWLVVFLFGVGVGLAETVISRRGGTHRVGLAGQLNLGDRGMPREVEKIREPGRRPCHYSPK